MRGLSSRRLWAAPPLILVALSLGLPLPVGAATFDIDDLAAPRLPGASVLSAPPGLALPPELKGSPRLPAPSPALGAAGEVAFKTATARLLAGDFPGAEKIARDLVRSAPEAPEGWHLLGMVLANLDRREEAVEALDRAAAGYRNNAAPLLVKGDLLLSLGRIEAAGAAWEAAAARDPSNSGARGRFAAYLEAKGDRDGALREYEAAAEHAAAGDPGPRLQAARLHLLAGAPARAEALLEPLAAQADPPLLALDYLGRAKVGLDKLEEGAALFDRLIPLAQGPRPALARARIAVSARDLPKAAEVLAAARQRFPKDPALLLEQGRILGAQGDYPAALEALAEGLTSAPDDPALLRAATLAASRLGDQPAALAHARRAAELPGASPEDRLHLAALLERGGAPKEAEAAYRALLAEDPGQWLALNNLANLLLESAPTEALSLAERAVAVKSDARLRDTLGLAQAKAGDPEAAQRTFESLRKETPGAALPVFRLGQLYLSQNRKEAGRALLQEALRLEPDFSKAEDARRLLAGGG